MNSPGAAGRAPASTSIRTTACGAASPPCVVTSTVSSPVAERGARKTVQTTWSTRCPPASTIQPVCAVWPGASRSAGDENRDATRRTAPGPETRTTASAAVPPRRGEGDDGGVGMQEGGRRKEGISSFLLPLSFLLAHRLFRRALASATAFVVARPLERPFSFALAVATGTPLTSPLSAWSWTCLFTIRCWTTEKMLNAR